MSTEGLRHTTFKENRYAVGCGFLIAMFSFQYGLDITAIGGLQAMKGFLEVFGFADPLVPGGWNIDPTVQALMSSLLQLGGGVSAVGGGMLSQYLGRQNVLRLGSLINVAAITILLLTTSTGGLYAGRFILGLANGLFLSQTQLYLQEIAPAHYRGLFLGMFAIWVSVSALVGSIVTNYTAPLAGRIAYQIPIAILYPIPVFLSIAFFFIPESPRWLASKERYEEAGKALRKLRGSTVSEALVEAELQEMIEADKMEKEHAKTSNWFDLWRGTNRRRTILAVCVAALQPASGAMFVIMYGTYFFTIAGVGEPFKNSVGVSGAGVGAMIFSLYLIKFFGRRNVLFFPTVGSALAMLAIAVAYTVAPGETASGKALVAMSVLFTFGYSCGIGAYSWLVAGEIPSQRLRSHTLGLGVAVAFLGAWLTVYTAPYFINPQSLGWGPKYGYIWFVSNLLCLVFIYFFLPETKDRTLAEITEMFEAGLPARKWKGYKCRVVGDSLAGPSTPTLEKEKDMGETHHIETLDRV